VTKPFLSIIIPAHNEESRLPSTLEKVYSFLQEQSYSSEVLIVENGSSDNTLKVAQSFQQHFPNLIVIKELGTGKGMAVRKGMLTASGDYRFMCDADLSMPIKEVKRFIPPKLENIDIAIASREAPGAIRYNEPGYRHWGGRGVNIMIRLLAVPGLHDTQCGFKMFRGAIATDLFRDQTLNNWSFDIELLFIARKRGYRIQELPIPWYFNPDTKLNPIKDAFQMAVDIISIHRNALRGVYDAKD
jgi:glycosyltransferase involved in cell wall biosynthesis